MKGRAGTVTVVVLGLGGAVAFSIGLYQLIKVGTCASGGPFVSARQCPSGTGGDVGLLVGGILGCTAALMVSLFGGNGRLAWGLIWPAMFCGGGLAALIAGLGSNAGPGGTTGAVIVGIVFIPMGLGPLAWGLLTWRSTRDIRAAARGTGPIDPFLARAYAAAHPDATPPTPPTAQAPPVTATPDPSGAPLPESGLGGSEPTGLEG